MSLSMPTCSKALVRHLNDNKIKEAIADMLQQDNSSTTQVRGLAGLLSLSVHTIVHEVEAGITSCGPSVLPALTPSLSPPLQASRSGLVLMCEFLNLASSELLPLAGSQPKSRTTKTKDLPSDKPAAKQRCAMSTCEITSSSF